MKVDKKRSRYNEHIQWIVYNRYNQLTVNRLKKREKKCRNNSLDKALASLNQLCRS